MKINGAMPWIMSICAGLITASAAGSSFLLYNVSIDVAQIKESVTSISERVDRQDTRNTKDHDEFYSRLRDVERGDR